jgi:tetratricopeptide (TPR) repeat protein
MLHDTMTLPWYGCVMRWAAVLLGSVGLILGLHGIASAQSARELAAARRLYQEGVAHAQAERWEDAREAFSQSLELAERPAALLNYAGASVQTARLLEAAEAYRRYLRIVDAGVRRSQAEALLQQLEERLARVTIEVIGLERDDRLSIDGEPASRALIGAEAPFDPGAHTIRLLRDEAIVAREELELAEGEVRHVELDARSESLERPSAAGAAQEPASEPFAPEPVDEGDGVLESPWFWIIVGAVVIAGGVIASVLLLGGDSGPGPYTGNIGSGRLAIP